MKKCLWRRSIRANLFGLALSISPLILTSAYAACGVTEGAGGVAKATSAECIAKMIEESYPCVFPRTNCQSYATNMRMATNLFDLRNSAPQVESTGAKIDLSLYGAPKFLPPFWRSMDVDSSNNSVFGRGADVFTWGIFHTKNNSVCFGPLIVSEYPTGIHGVSGGEDVYTLGAFVTFKLSNPPGRDEK
ncbi:MAG: hypothetical protein NTV72_00605 [Candidatus Taylorbacteria bacterium]|nr:hypothetical protein [Candidatus Taylorbacteria bacterium]